MRPGFAIVLAACLAAGGCDKPSPQAEQANETSAEVSPDEVVADANAPQIKPGVPDDSHKGEAAPTLAFSGPGGEQTLADFRGKPVLLNLWATWCAPCVKEMPMLDTLAGTLDGKVQVLTISQDLEGEAKVKPFFATGGYKSLKPYLDTKAAFSTTLGVNLPTTILYDSSGKEVWRVTGEMNWNGTEARKRIAEAS